MELETLKTEEKNLRDAAKKLSSGIKSSAVDWNDAKFSELENSIKELALLVSTALQISHNAVKSMEAFEKLTGKENFHG